MLGTILIIRVYSRWGSRAPQEQASSLGGPNKDTSRLNGQAKNRPLAHMLFAESASQWLQPMGIWALSVSRKSPHVTWIWIMFPTERTNAPLTWRWIRGFISKSLFFRSSRRTNRCISVSLSLNTNWKPSPMKLTSRSGRRKKRQTDWTWKFYLR